jgi:hypothetical protein
MIWKIDGFKEIVKISKYERITARKIVSRAQACYNSRISQFWGNFQSFMWKTAFTNELDAFVWKFGNW